MAKIILNFDSMTKST